ncbi:hypothetical protein C427_1084 [Paraglaciecola psychrophila 170]|uniref:Uncharacterized protein n=1 Tax=Paraglaciecola psychrophila 170 TaxID=1129794 RepID=K6YW48_9ALTE|nr:hypothetical protein C427_1084 [Paraglaciecola psychrophila 170]GAC36934.1 hypothetical protein GPSY_1299 [Paraglaciecola psychrophila 170]
MEQQHQTDLSLSMNQTPLKKVQVNLKQVSKTVIFHLY